jgi:hypothetical protein
VPITVTVENTQTGARGQVAFDAPVHALGAKAGNMPGDHMMH